MKDRVALNDVLFLHDKSFLDDSINHFDASYVK